MIYLDTYDSPIGQLSLASDGIYLCGLWMENQKYYQDKLEIRLNIKTKSAIAKLTERLYAPEARCHPAFFEDARKWLDIYFSGGEPSSAPPLRLRGTGFQEEVWAILQNIPYGQLTTYGAIAKQIANSRGAETASARAVGVAVGRNPVSVIVPCHRVVGSNNSLTGYAGGIRRKIYLLELEGIDVNKLSVPAKGTAL
ncbi:MAG: methylated-DNA--[protein]-cysteine S-methyltransferase [Oscillospiraceae bacterium]|jgi:methylated-DNA-[protein]-cysteine S-methyltransferase|nr:methylated-DNA--[protein]-cysteine S-methyltransferase [Oscillospiraceae bacterium]